MVELPPACVPHFTVRHLKWLLLCVTQLQLEPEHFTDLLVFLLARPPKAIDSKKLEVFPVGQRFRQGRVDEATTVNWCDDTPSDAATVTAVLAAVAAVARTMESNTLLVSARFVCHQAFPGLDFACPSLDHFDKETGKKLWPVLSALRRQEAQRALPSEADERDVECEVAVVDFFSLILVRCLVVVAPRLCKEATADDAAERLLDLVGSAVSGFVAKAKLTVGATVKIVLDGQPVLKKAGRGPVDASSLNFALRLFALGTGGFEKHLVRKAKRVLRNFVNTKKMVLLDPCVNTAVATCESLGLKAEVVQASGEADVCCRQLGEQLVEEETKFVLGSSDTDLVLSSLGECARWVWYDDGYKSVLCAFDILVRSLDSSSSGALKSITHENKTRRLLTLLCSVLRELAGSDVSPGVERVGFSTAVSTYGPSLATALKPLASATHRRHCAVARAVFTWAAEHASHVPLTTRVGWYDAVAINVDYLSATWTVVSPRDDLTTVQSSRFELLLGSFLDERAPDENGTTFRRPSLRSRLRGGGAGSRYQGQGVRLSSSTFSSLALLDSAPAERKKVSDNSTTGKAFRDNLYSKAKRVFEEHSSTLLDRVTAVDRLVAHDGVTVTTAGSRVVLNGVATFRDTLGPSLFFTLVPTAESRRNSSVATAVQLKQLGDSLSSSSPVVGCGDYHLRVGVKSGARPRARTEFVRLDEEALCVHTVQPVVRVVAGPPAVASAGHIFCSLSSGPKLTLKPSDEVGPTPLRCWDRHGNPRSLSADLVSVSGPPGRRPALTFEDSKVSLSVPNSCRPGLYLFIAKDTGVELGGVEVDKSAPAAPSASRTSAKLLAHSLVDRHGVVSRSLSVARACRSPLREAVVAVTCRVTRTLLDRARRSLAEAYTTLVYAEEPLTVRALPVWSQTALVTFLHRGAHRLDGVPVRVADAVAGSLAGNIASAAANATRVIIIQRLHGVVVGHFSADPNHKLWSLAKLKPFLTLFAARLLGRGESDGVGEEEEDEDQSATWDGLAGHPQAASLRALLRGTPSEDFTNALNDALPHLPRVSVGRGNKWKKKVAKVTVEQKLLFTTAENRRRGRVHYFVYPRPNGKRDGMFVSLPVFTLAWMVRTVNQVLAYTDRPRDNALHAEVYDEWQERGGESAADTIDVKGLGTLEHHSSSELTALFAPGLVDFVDDLNARGGNFVFADSLASNGTEFRLLLHPLSTLRKVKAGSVAAKRKRDETRRHDSRSFRSVLDGAAADSSNLKALLGASFRGLAGLKHVVDKERALRPSATSLSDLTVVAIDPGKKDVMTLVAGRPVFRGDRLAAIEGVRLRLSGARLHWMCERKGWLINQEHLSTTRNWLDDDATRSPDEEVRKAAFATAANVGYRAVDDQSHRGEARAARSRGRQRAEAELQNCVKRAVALATAGRGISDGSAGRPSNVLVLCGAGGYDGSADRWTYSGWSAFEVAKILGRSFLTLFVDEYLTSQLCPACGSKLAPVDGKNWRTRCCPTRDCLFHTRRLSKDETAALAIARIGLEQLLTGERPAPFRRSGPATGEHDPPD